MNNNNSSVNNNDLFKSIVFYLIGVPIGEQNKIKTLLKKCGGSIALQVNKSVHYLITTTEEVEKASYKIKGATKLCDEGELRLVSTQYITDCVEANRLLSDDRYQLYKSKVLHSQKFKFSNSGSGGTGKKGGQSSTSTNQKQQQQQKQCFNILELLSNSKKKSTTTTTTTR
ncbi:hypothetical protein PPL_07270 [Heterostelium album PN500]|uniref:BRCT domain-containing protein n=1 Tax=Heterostelium pallidum (strain ATCC 26659 / Pp 5 / PN500) TaxID=670386 RepID=D3BEV4_HETP5|nr:hypothetical protein PPL_07270 [Heterostelium album PN500]EFA80435.1 hypothetical protein PPL_07270 [Heterostelium album PN500]|eukprot:XP_020432555.1 hypothetical protein PPL_07270 [Heterostelium album PN500]